MNRLAVSAGYSHPLYAHSLEKFGEPRELPSCGGWILERPIFGTTYKDGMGCYPLFVCRNWAGLPEDLDVIGDDLVSLSLVTDPFANFDPEWLRRHFDVFAAFKEHFVADLTQPIEGFVSKSHRSAVRRALQKVDVEWCAEPATYLDVWVELFGHLMRRHNISGVRAFSREGFARQLRTPGLVMFKALFQGEIVGLDLWYVHGDVAYGHLVAMSPEGYRLRASYALKWYLLHYFAEKVHWLDFGGGAGTEAAGNDGLSRFKEGWSTGTRTVYFCGRILNRERYCELAEAKGDVGGRYFPVYREGEFD